VGEIIPRVVRRGGNESGMVEVAERFEEASGPYQFLMNTSRKQGRLQFCQGDSFFAWQKCENKLGKVLLFHLSLALLWCFRDGQ
jgi:hypothetical protein